MKSVFVALSITLLLITSGCRDKGAFDWRGNLIVDCDFGPLTNSEITVYTPGPYFKTTTDADGGFSISGSWNVSCPGSYGCNYDPPTLVAEWYNFTLGHTQRAEVVLYKTVNDYGDLVLHDSLFLNISLDTSAMNCQGCQLSLRLRQDNIGNMWAYNEVVLNGTDVQLPINATLAYKPNQPTPLFPIILSYQIYNPTNQMWYRSYKDVDITTRVNRCVPEVDSITLKL